MRCNFGSLFGNGKKSRSRRLGSHRIGSDENLSVISRIIDDGLEDRLLLAAQVISSDAPTKSLVVGESVDIPVMYQTLNDNGVPTGLSADGIDFNLHFNSSILRFDSVRNVFGEGLTINPGTTTPEANVTGSDSDPTTDTVLRAQYTNNDAIPGWPNSPDSSGEILYIARFTALAGFHGSTINFSANAAVDGFNFQANSVALDAPTGPTLSIFDSPVTMEGDNLTFSVVLSPAATETVTVQYSTLDGNGPSGATAGEDYVAATDQVLTFQPGETQKTITVATIDDAFPDPDETMTVVLSSPTNAAIGVRDAVGPIQDGDANLPRLTISDAGIVGEGGNSVFTVSLTMAASSPVTVNYSTADGEGPTAATNGVDFTAQTDQTLTFAVGETQKTISVATIDDAQQEEAIEEFRVLLSNASGATISRTEGIGEISDNDAGLPQISISDAAAVTEGQGSQFVVSLSPAATGTVTVSYSTATGLGPTGAVNGTDFQSQTNQTLTFTPGQTTKTITITTIDDLIDETTEEFLVNLLGASGASVADSQGQGLINDNDSTQSTGDVDGDADFDANDSFMIQLVKLSGTDAQIDQSKGSSSLSATQIRASANALALAADVDGDNDFDANDAFLIHLVKLSGSDGQLDQSKGSSPLTATQIRANINALNVPPSSVFAPGGQENLLSDSSVASNQSTSLFGKGENEVDRRDEEQLVDLNSEQSEVSSNGQVHLSGVPVDSVWANYRQWIEAI